MMQKNPYGIFLHQPGILQKYEQRTRNKTFGNIWARMGDT